MKKRRRWNERTRMLLTLELAIVLPAAALIAYSIWNLRSIQRDRAVEAAIQRDFSQVLKIAEKRMNEETYKLIRRIQEDLPCPEDKISAKLDALLAAHPEVAHVYFYEPSGGLVFRSQPGRMHEPAFHKERESQLKDARMMAAELPDSGAETLKKLRTLDSRENIPGLFYGSWPWRGDKYVYQPRVMMLAPAWPKEKTVLAGVALDVEHLRTAYWPSLLDTVLAKDNPNAQDGKNGSRAVMMIHVKKETEPLAASAGWDGGKPEVERPFEGAFPGLTLAIKFRGTTIEAISRRFLNTGFWIIGGLSMFLAGGVLLTYRNVNREMALARLKSDFVANVSHELRTPLALIRLYAETLEMGRVSGEEKLREYHSTIRKESERLTALINNILDFSRIEAGKKEYEFRETNLQELVRTTLESYRYQIEENGFTIQDHIAEDVPPVRVDREAIARSLLNLVNNAVKYSPQEKFVSVHLYRANGSVKLEVEDRGIGIPKGEQEKVFEKFYRAGDPLVHNTKGSGLGLSLVRHIVEAHGGRVELQSSPGRGSKFTIVLPLEPAPAPARADNGAGASLAGVPR
jgi:signal transduction histidine kinase